MTKLSSKQFLSMGVGSMIWVIPGPKLMILFLAWFCDSRIEHVSCYDKHTLRAVTTQRRLRWAQPPRCVLREFSGTRGCLHNLGRTRWGERRLYSN